MNMIQTIPAGRAVALNSTAVVVVDACAPSLPPAVVTGINRLMLAFPIRGLSEQEDALVKGNYRDAVHGFELPVVLWTLSWLRFNNPRNKPDFTEAPNCQDVRNACEQTRRDWEAWVVDYYIDKDGVWGKPYNGATSASRWHARRLVADWAHRVGEPPGSDGCHVPQGMIERILRDHLDRPRCIAAMCEMPDERFARIPERGFPPGLRDELVNRRAEIKRRADELQRLYAYLRTMDPELRDFRRNLLLVHRRDQQLAIWERSTDFPPEEFKYPLMPELTEEALMEKARDGLAKWKSAKTEAEAHGGELCGSWTQFAGGLVKAEVGLYPRDLRCVPLAELERDYP